MRNDAPDLLLGAARNVLRREVSVMIAKQPELMDEIGRTFYGRAEQTMGGVWFYRDGTKIIPLRLKTIPAQLEGAS